MKWLSESPSKGLQKRLPQGRSWFWLWGGLLLAGVPARAEVESLPTSAPQVDAALFSDARWDPVSDGDRIRIFRWDAPNSNVRAFRALGEVDAPIAKVVSVITDTARLQEWMPSLAEAKLLKKISDVERVQYTHIKTPFVIKDRDFVIHGRALFDPASRSIVLRFSSADPEKFGIGKVSTDFVRGEILESSYRLTPIDGMKRTQVEFLVQVDPKGSVPKWIVNLFQGIYPRKSILALRKQVTKLDIADHPLVLKAYASAPTPESAKQP